jgi:hypothetical protein
MLSQVEADQLIAQPPLTFSFTVDKKASHWAWTSFRGSVEAKIRGWVSAYSLGDQLEGNDAAYPVCSIGRELVRPGVYEAIFAAEPIMLFSWTVALYCDEYGCPLRRGVLVLPRDRKTILDVGRCYQEQSMYL